MAPARQLADKAARLRELHVPGQPLILPNVWDAASAIAVVEAGFPVVATSSGAVADVLGYADHEGTPVDEMFAAVARICRAVDVPVTADLEAGYDLSADELVFRMLEAGAVGCNIEDTEHPAESRVSPNAQAARLEAIRKAAIAHGVDIVLNARIDSWLHPGDDAERLDDALTRARVYHDAGADCVFPIGLADMTTIGRFVDGAGVAVNVLRRLDGASLAALAELKVARISHGSQLLRQQDAALRRTLSDFGDPRTVGTSPA